MRSVNQAYRRSIFNAGDGQIIYRGVTIPIWSDFDNGDEADLNIGNNMPVTAWIRLMEQDANNVSPKCIRADQAAITIQVQTSFIGTSGNYEHSENIMDLYLTQLFDNGVTIEEPFALKRLDKISETNLNYQDDVNRIFMTAVTLTGTVEQ